MPDVAAYQAQGPTAAALRDNAVETADAYGEGRAYVMEIAVASQVQVGPGTTFVAQVTATYED